MSVNVITKGTGQVGRLLVGKALIFTGAGVPVDGTTGAGKAGPGSLYLDQTNGGAYINAGTKASPIWHYLDAATNVRHATVTLTNAQVKALRATPFTCAAAPGANKMSQFIGAVLNVDGSAGAFTESSDNLAFKYVDGSGVAVSETIEATGFIDQAGKMLTNAVPKKDVILTEAQGENAAIVLHNTGDGEYGGGNAANTLKVTMAYRVVPTL